MESEPKILFLDIDGVLNRHDGIHDIHPECVEQLNRVIYASLPVQAVLSSAWRYIIHQGDMTCEGFTYMLRTHGVTSALRIVDVTCEDGKLPKDMVGDMEIKDAWTSERAKQILHWLDKHPKINHFAVVDDMPLPDFGSRFVQTNPDKGLTSENADALISILNRH